MSSQQLVLVTGAAGFTGRYFIAAAVEAGYRCVALVQHAGEPVPGAEESIGCDIGDRAALAGIVARVRPDHVVHLAAISFVAHGDLQQMYVTNVVGTANLIDAIAQLDRPPRRVILASSANVYGNVSSLPIGEDCEPVPENDYAVSKRAMEMAARLRMRRVPLVIARPFNYTGVGQSPDFLIPKIVSAFRERRTTLELGNLDVSRDFSDVRDVARAYLGLLKIPEASGVYNICSGRSTSLRSIIAMLEASSGHSVQVVTNPALVRSNEIADLFGKKDRLVHLIGEFQEFSLPETLQWMLRE